jgi:hypothetical protein
MKYNYNNIQYNKKILHSSYKTRKTCPSLVNERKLETFAPVLSDLQ